MINNYFDNAATTETEFFAKDFYIPGNPNSPTAIGRKANEALEEAKQRIKDCLGVKGGEVFICRCATEAIDSIYNLCKSYEAYNYCSLYDFCSIYEHDSIYDRSANVFSAVNRIKDWAEENNICFYQYVNNITGTSHDIETIGKSCRNNKAYFISDFTATIGHKEILDNLEEFCDGVIASGHKFGAEQGIGFIWLNNRLIDFFGKVNIKKEFDGTPNVSGAIAMSYAMESAVNWQKKYGEKHFTKLFNYLDQKLEENRILRWYVNGKNGNYTNAINAIVFPEINADALVQYLSSKGIYISAGHSACSGDDPNASRVLEAFGLTKEEPEHTVRISFSKDNTFEEIDILVSAIVDFKNKFC